MHLTEPDRQYDVNAGIMAALLLTGNDNIMSIVQRLVNAGQILTFQLPSQELIELSGSNSKLLDEYFLSCCTYADSYYFGKIIGDVVVSAVGVGLTVKSIFDIINGAGMTGIGTVTAPTGAGACVAAAGAALTVEGAITITVGLELAANAIMNASSDSKDYDDSYTYTGTGEYGKVKGHHVHAKAAFEGDASYDPDKGFSISKEFMQKYKLIHARITAKQHELFTELAKSNRPNTLEEHTRIAKEALRAGGLKDETVIDNLINDSLSNLRKQGVTAPTRIPWN